MSVAGIGNRIIAAGGYDSGDTDLTRIYDIASDTWTSGSNAPGVNSEGAGISHGGFFYSVGGRANHTALWRYDPLADAWAVMVSIPEAKRGLGVAVVGNKIYAIGGSDGGAPCSGTPSENVYRYDIATDTWTQVADLPSARMDLAAQEMRGKIS
jgi:hypothetical protein